MDRQDRYREINGEVGRGAKRRSASSRRPGSNKKCPFCGCFSLGISLNLDADADGNSTHAIECEVCASWGPWVTGPESRVWYFWNQRGAAPEELSVEKRIFAPKSYKEERSGKKATLLKKLEPTLRRCPFCSSTNIVLVDLVNEDVWFANCENCSTCGPTPEDDKENTPEQAAAEWNGSLLGEGE